MKKKPEKTEPIKLEKKNKVLKKEELDFVLNEEKNNKEKKKEEKKKENINIFTAGLSYEKIDHNKYNKALTNFNHLFGKDLNKGNNNKKGPEKIDKKVQISKKYLYERVLCKNIEIEINLENNNIKKDEDKKEIILLLNTFLSEKNNFFYYEFSNSKHISFNKLSEGDMLLYKSFIKELDIIDNNNASNKEEYIKQVDYVNTMNSLYYQFIINQKLFYIITPLYSFSFDFKKEIPLLLTNSKTLEVELKKNNIQIIKLKDKLEKNKININSNESRNTEKTKNNNINKMDINEEETIKIEHAPFGVSKLYSGLLYNYFVNKNILKPFNIFSDFEFEGGIFRKCKYQIINVNNNNENIIIKIEGIIFGKSIDKIINYIRKELKINYFSMRLNNIKSTSCFYMDDKEIESYSNKFDIKKEYFYFYKQ